jgi:hypothetical protein
MGGPGANAVGGAGGNGGAANHGFGGGLFNAGTASFTGMTVNFTEDQATSGSGGNGANGGDATGGNGGDASTGPGIRGGDASSGIAGIGGAGGSGQGGGINNVATGRLTIDPSQGVRKNSSQAKAIGVITANSANAASAGPTGNSGRASGGLGGKPAGNTGKATEPTASAVVPPSVGIGGGVSNSGTATIVNTPISRNNAATSGSDVNGPISM